MRKKSVVWLFFDKNDAAETVSCKLCGSSLTYCNSTSNMLKHIQGKHPTAMKSSNSAGLPTKVEEKTEEDIWLYMERQGPSTVMCSVCLTVLSGVTKKNTAIFKQHLKTEHPDLNSSLVKTSAAQMTYGEEVDENAEEQNGKHAPGDSDSDNDYTLPPSRKKSKHEHFQKITQAKHDRPRPKIKVGRKYNSMVWQFMIRSDSYKTVCGLCNKPFAYAQGSTSNMLRHLNIVHAQEVKDYQNGKIPIFMNSHEVPDLTNIPEMKTLNLSVSAAVPNSIHKPREIRRETSATEVKQFDQHVVNMIVSNLYPCSLFEDASFKKLSKSLNSKCLLPDKKCIEGALETLHKKHKKLLQSQLDDAPGLSITVDVWVYQEKEQYMTVTGHFVSKNWELKSAVLKTVLLDPCKDLSAGVAESLCQILADWNVAQKVQCIITGGEEQIVAGVSQLNKPQFQCMASGLNLMVQRSLNAFEDIMYVAQRIRDVAKYFHYSKEASDKLCSVLKDGGAEPTKLERDTETNWFSTFKMLKSYLELQDSVRIVLEHTQKLEMLLSPEELELLAQCVQILEPFHLACEDMASDDYPLLSKIIPVFEILQQMVSNLFQMCSSAQDSVSALAKELNDQVGLHIDKIKTRENLNAWAATLLDPRFKHVVLKDSAIHACVAENIQDLITTNDASHTGGERVEHASSLAKASSASILWSVFDETIKKSANEDAPNDLHRYTEEKLIMRQEDPFLWWKEREPLYPKLCKVVKQFLCVPATSVPTNQVFFEEEKRRINRINSLEECHLDSILFLRSCQLVP